MVSWANISQPPNGISISSAVFVQLTRMLYTQTQTDTQTALGATSVAMASSHAMRAGHVV